MSPDTNFDEVIEDFDAVEQMKKKADPDDANGEQGDGQNGAGDGKAAWGD